MPIVVITPPALANLADLGGREHVLDAALEALVDDEVFGDRLSGLLDDLLCGRQEVDCDARRAYVHGSKRHSRSWLKLMQSVVLSATVRARRTAWCFLGQLVCRVRATARGHAIREDPEPEPDPGRRRM